MLSGGGGFRGGGRGGRGGRGGGGGGGRGRGGGKSNALTSNLFFACLLSGVADQEYRSNAADAAAITFTCPCATNFFLAAAAAVQVLEVSRVREEVVVEVVAGVVVVVVGVEAQRRWW